MIIKGKCIHSNEAVDASKLLWREMHSIYWDKIYLVLRCTLFDWKYMHPDNDLILPNAIEKILFLKLHILGARPDYPLAAK